ncbi:MAG: hypothetical protein ACFBSG_09990 [Leptolyngbyaceae cyanobacterium]
MNSRKKVAMLTVGSTVSLSVMGVSAQAQAAGTAADLMPLDSAGASIETMPDQLKAAGVVTATLKPEATYRPEMLHAVAREINGEQQASESTETPDIGDLVDLSFIEQFIDEDGNIDLPLGITVYEAMGKTSIGFGGEFR